MEPTQVLRIAGLTAGRRLEGRFWRAVDGAKPLDTNGTLAGGGRYNPPGEFGALYCSDSPEQASSEKAAQAADQPVRLVPIDVALAFVLDLSDPFCRASFLLRESDLTGRDHELTRRIGRAARAVGLEALLVPAAQGLGRNLVVFLDRLLPASRVRAATEQASERARQPERRSA